MLTSASYSAPRLSNAAAIRETLASAKIVPRTLGYPTDIPVLNAKKAPITIPVSELTPDSLPSSYIDRYWPYGYGIAHEDMVIPWVNTAWAQNTSLTFKAPYNSQNRHTPYNGGFTAPISPMADEHWLVEDTWSASEPRYDEKEGTDWGGLFSIGAFVVWLAATLFVLWTPIGLMKKVHAPYVPDFGQSRMHPKLQGSDMDILPGIDGSTATAWHTRGGADVSAYDWDWWNREHGTVDGRVPGPNFAGNDHLRNNVSFQEY